MSAATPQQPSIKEVWKLAGEAVRSQAVEELCELKDCEGWPPQLETSVANAVNFRPAKVRSAKGNEALRWLPGAMFRLSAPELSQALALLHTTKRLPLLSGFLDACDIDHENGEVSAQAREEPIPTDKALACLPRLVEDFGTEDVYLFLHTLRTAGFPAWKATALALCEALKDRSAEGAEPEPGDVEPERQPEAAAQAPEEEEALRELPGFTTLDRALIRAIVASLNQVQGSLSLDELDDLVGEVVALNEAREQSHFFLGYLDSLLGRELRSVQKGDNASRRAWYLSGYLHGVLRLQSTPGALASLDNLDVEDRERLRTAPCAAGSLLAGELVPRLLSAGRPADAADWIQEHFTVIAPRILGPILHWARHELSGGDPEAVRLVLEVTRELLPRVSSELEPVPRDLRRELARRLGTALRRTGRADESRQIVEEMLADCSDENEEAGLLSDRALLDVGVRSLELVALGAPDTRETLVAAIRNHAEQLEEAASRPVHTPIPPLLLALPTVVDPESASKDVERALELLRRALSSIRDMEFWQRTGVLQLIKLGLSVLELRGLQPDIAPQAANRLAQVLEDESVHPPLDLVEETLENLALVESPGAGRAARVALARWPSLLGSVTLDDLARRNKELRLAVLEALGKTDALTGRERWEAWDGLLRAALGASPRDLDTARLAVDELETLATEGFDSEFLALLDDRDRWDPAWTQLERDEARVRVFEASGSANEAAAALVSLIHRTIGEGADAEDLLDRLRSLTDDPDTIADLEKRISALAGEEPHPENRPRPTRHIHVLFVGGNETQVAYQESIEEWLQDNYSGCSVDFEFSGWGSNWGRMVARLDGRLDRADALVLMRFIRTQLGRTLRRKADEHGIPWVACSGHGRDSLRRAIERAIQVAHQLSMSSPEDRTPSGPS